MPPAIPRRKPDETPKQARHPLAHDPAALQAEMDRVSEEWNRIHAIYGSVIDSFRGPDEFDVIKGGSNHG